MTIARWRRGLQEQLLSLCQRWCAYFQCRTQVLLQTWVAELGCPILFEPCELRGSPGVARVRDSVRQAPQARRGGFRCCRLPKRRRPLGFAGSGGLWLRRHRRLLVRRVRGAFISREEPGRGIRSVGALELRATPGCGRRWRPGRRCRGQASHGRRLVRVRHEAGRRWQRRLLLIPLNLRLQIALTGHSSRR